MSSIYLCTTALSQFWNQHSDNNIMLGEWCLLYDRKEEWGNMNYYILPHPWNDREAMHKASAYEDEIYEQLLVNVRDFLNEVHNEQNDTHYWRIILGTWLLHYVQIMHERYLCLRNALDRFPGINTFGLASSSFKVPRSFADFIKGSFRDIYNLQIYTSLLNAMGIATKEKDFQWSWDNASTETTSLLDKALYKPINCLRRLTPYWARYGYIIMTDMYFPSPRLVLKLIIGSGFKARWVELPRSESWMPETCEQDFNASRQGLANLKLNQSDDFVSILIEILPIYFPFIYLENYKTCLNWIDRIWCGRSNKKLITSTAWTTNDTFNILAAYMQKKSSKLIACQHGGSYGSARNHTSERLERTAADEFWSWGWGGNESGVIPMPSPKLSWISTKKRQHIKKKSRYIYFIGNIVPRYFYRNSSWPVANQVNQYINWQILFLKTLNSQVIKDLVFRPPLDDCDLGVQRLIRESIQGINIEDVGKNYYEGILNATLVICDMNQTSFLEALAANIPTILFWDKNLWELRPQAEVHYKGLYDAGILFHDPAEAAEEVNNIWSNVDAWWALQRIQEVRKDFVRQYALSSRDWVKIWREKLLDEKNVTN